MLPRLALLALLVPAVAGNMVREKAKRVEKEEREEREAKKAGHKKTPGSNHKWGDANPNPGWDKYYKGKCDEFLKCSADGDLNCLDKSGIPLCNLEIQQTQCEMPWQRGLGEAAAHGHLHVVQYMIQNDLKWWDKNDLVNENRETVLMHAAAHGETAVVKWLLDIGADVRLRSSTGENAMDLAREGGWGETMDAISNYKAYSTRSLLRTFRERLPATVADVETFACGGADVAAVDSTRQLTALGMAVQNGNLELVVSLVALGSPLETIHPRTGQNPLHMACDEGNFAIAQQLVAGGADVNALSLQFNMNCLHLGAANGRNGIMALMIRNGVNVNAKDWKGETALLKYTRQMYGSGETQVAVVDSILSAGGTTGGHDADGHTAMYYAIKNNQIQAVQSMVRSGAGTNAVSVENGRDISAAELARQHHAPEIQKWLSNYSKDL